MRREGEAWHEFQSEAASRGSGSRAGRGADGGRVSRRSEEEVMTAEGVMTFGVHLCVGLAVRIEKRGQPDGQRGGLRHGGRNG